MAILTNKFHDYKLRAGDNLEVPTMATPVVHGTSGSTSYEYKATFKTLVGETTPTDTVTCSTGNATLSSVNFIRLTVSSVPAGVTKVRFYKNDGTGAFKLLGEANPETPVLDDIGQSLTADTLVPSTNNSGRPEWRAVLFNHGKFLQRQELIDLQWICLRGIKELGDSIHKNGDVITGCVEQSVSGTIYNFTSGKIYLDGQHVTVPSGQVTLQGSGTEWVGLQVTPTVITANDDNVLRNHDEGVDLIYATDGADRLTYDVSWVVDQDGQVNIREFLDGSPLTREITTEYTELNKILQRRTYDVSGDFVVRNFPMKMVAHDDDDTKLNCKISAGKAYVHGVEISTIATQSVEVPKGRDTKSANNSPLNAFNYTGGYVTATGTGPFNVNGLNVKLQFGSGNEHTVSLTGTSVTASGVASQIESGINSYPTSDDLVDCVDVSNKLYISAPDGKDLKIKAVGSDAYSVLGLSTGTYTASGTRIYECNNDYIKDVSDLNYVCEIVEAVTHDGSDHIDALGNSNVADIIGASDTQADCHDGAYDYQKNVDFVKNGDSIDFSTLGGSDPTNGATYYVKYRYTRNATKGTRVRVRVVDAEITKGAEDGKDTLTFTNGTATEVQSGNSVTGLSGNASDVIRILRVNNSTGQSSSDYSSDVYSLVKNSNAVEHNDSEIDWSDAGSQGSTPDGQPTTGATYYVTFEYWRHTTEGDYVSADSYINDYEEIETAPDGTTELRDCIDFRTTSSYKPVDSDIPRLDYNYYLGRYDKIALGSDGHFFRIAGTPSITPIIPSNQTGSLSLMSLYVPPYTYNASDVTKDTLEITRRSQQGIHELAAKIERLEYYQALQQTRDSALSNSAASDAKGIFTDSLVGHKHGDVNFSTNGIEFTASVDTEEQCVRLPVTESGTAIGLDEVNSSNITKIGKVIVFDYEDSTYINQSKASSIINVNPYAIYGWVGTMEIDPETDYWTDVNQLPVIDLNYDQQMSWVNQQNAERARQLNWSSWSLAWNKHTNNWFSQHLQRANDPAHWRNTSQEDSRTPVAMRERTASFDKLIPNRTLVEVNDELLDVTVLPYCRTTLDGGSPFEIDLEIHGMKPNTDICCTIDDVAVDLTATEDTDAGTATYKGKTSVETNGAGYATCSFTMPTGITVGQKAIKVFSATDPEESYALSLFTSQGFRETRQRTVEGLMTLSERSVTLTQQQFGYRDPLAQTFAIEQSNTYLSAVTLYFQSKDASLPVTVEIRQTDNGFPTDEIIQSKTLYPEDINVSDDGTVGTKFVFPNIVSYGAGEYAIAVISNCQGYHVWKAVMGEEDIVTNEIIRQQPYDGILFTSPNNSTWTPQNSEDLKFMLHKSNFENDAQIVFNDITGIQANMMALAVTQLLPQSCNLLWSYSVDGGSNWEAFAPFMDTDLGSVATQVKLRADVSSTGGTFQILDSGAGIVLLLNQTSANYIGYNASFDESADKVTLITDLSVDGTGGTGTRSITPYYSVDNGSSWVEITTSSGYTPTSIGDGTYKEYKFETPDEKTVSDATNATPIVITSANHGFKDGSLVTIAGVVGNTAANGYFKVANSDTDTFELVDPDTGTDVAGNGSYSSGGTINLTDFDQCRIRLKLETSSQTVTPKAKNIRCICG